jgi:hypothetical protein
MRELVLSMHARRPGSVRSIRAIHPGRLSYLRRSRPGPGCRWFAGSARGARADPIDRSRGPVAYE